jgi:hypothetical protein
LAQVVLVVLAQITVLLVKIQFSLLSHQLVVDMVLVEYRVVLLLEEVVALAVVADLVVQQLVAQAHLVKAITEETVIVQRLMLPVVVVVLGLLV